MSVQHSLAHLKNNGWDILSLNFSDLILSREFEKQVLAILDVLDKSEFSISQSIIKRGGGLADQTDELSSEFSKIGSSNNISVENRIEFERELAPIVSNSTTHVIDHLVQNETGQLMALEVEWNNKDEFYDRDFQSIRRLYDLGVIEAGIIVTRGQSLEDNLLRMISNYFAQFPVHDFDDFERMKLNFPNPKEPGEYLFSFPTPPQRLQIKKKTRDGRRSFAEASAEVFKASKFAGTTTNWRQLQKRVERRDIGRTPLLCLGIPDSVFK